MHRIQDIMRLIKFLWQSESFQVPIPALETMHSGFTYRNSVALD